MDKKILIVSNSYDIHADLVMEKLQARGAEVFRLNQDDFPRDYGIAIQHGVSNVSCELGQLKSGQSLNLLDVGAIWTRKPAPFRFISDDLPAQERAFANAETAHLFNSILFSLDGFWMNHPKANRAALWKGEQLQRAAKFGFRVPRTLISNDPEQVRQFKQVLPGEMIVKTLSSASLSVEDVEPEFRQAGSLMTTIVDEQHMTSIDAVRELPCLFQEYVPKQYELRVTIIGQQVFAARIDSQRDQRTAIDYRDFSVDIPYQPERLSSELQTRCLGFVESYGLSYGAMDLIVTPDNEYVFLENNPSGQFLFIEQLVPELSMSDAVTDLLIRQSRQRR